MRLDLKDVQGNILVGYKRLHFAGYLFWRFTNVERGRSFLARLVGAPPEGADAWLRVMTATPWPEKDEVHEALNVAITFAGVEKLGWAADFTEFGAFREGMCERAEAHLADTGENAPDGWSQGGGNEPDGLLVVYADSEALRARRVAELRQRLDTFGLEEIALQEAGRIEEVSTEEFAAREHFGFRDGFSQPAVEGASTVYCTGEPPGTGEGLLRRPPVLGRWREVRLGEFLLGHEDEDEEWPGGWDVTSPRHNGTFMVWRKLEQKVDAFERFFERAAQGDRRRAEWMKAKAVGRWRDGTSLVDAPWSEPSAGDEATAGVPSNTFSYYEDPDGARCPIGAHVRRANPRVTLGWGTERSRRHRLIRRGLPYDDDTGQGLIFVCFNASIERQFEMVQRSWLMDGDAFGLGTEQDVLLGGGGAGAAVFKIPGDRDTPATFVSRGEEAFVRTLGGYYLFVPGVAALRRMTRGPRSEPPRSAGWLAYLEAGATVAWALRRRSRRRRVEQRRGVHH